MSNSFDDKPEKASMTALFRHSLRILCNGLTGLSKHPLSDFKIGM